MIGENTAIVNCENVSSLSIIDHFIPIHNANSDGNRDIINASSILDVYYFVLFFEGCLWYHFRTNISIDMSVFL